MGYTQCADLAPGPWAQVVLIRLSLRGYVRTPLYSCSQTFLLSLAIDPCVYLRYSFVQSSTPWHFIYNNIIMTPFINFTNIAI